MTYKVAVKQIEITTGIFNEFRHVESPVSGPCILVLPALGVAAKSYDSLIKALARKVGSAGVAYLRGQGASSVTANKLNNYGYTELIKEDIPAFINATNEIFHSPLYPLGHGLGGQLGCLYSTTLDPKVKGLILCTSGSIYFICWQGTERFKIPWGSQFARVYAKLKGCFPGRLFKFGDRTFQRLSNDLGKTST